ncbi:MULTISPECIES: hypothetical protein [unclassified Moorena]|uniref:hypothetical protein n=1 Tax=unclassified Moorena TaxID=2683338 RepID=UPI0013015841|nr:MULTISPECIES: hypothetical protein [unclassified Moorena]NEQ08367.1 hypothetical protein [Moorena sp. SIO4E2]NES44268.1 hypothetical protein [Moorena sp. SIO2C4]
MIPVNQLWFHKSVNPKHSAISRQLSAKGQGLLPRLSILINLELLNSPVCVLRIAHRRTLR